MKRRKGFNQRVRRSVQASMLPLAPRPVPMPDTVKPPKEKPIQIKGWFLSYEGAYNIVSDNVTIWILTKYINY